MLIGYESARRPEPAASAVGTQGELFRQVTLRLLLNQAENVGLQEVLVNGKTVFKILERRVGRQDKRRCRPLYREAVVPQIAAVIRAVGVADAAALVGIFINGSRLGRAFIEIRIGPLVHVFIVNRKPQTQGVSRFPHRPYVASGRMQIIHILLVGRLEISLTVIIKSTHRKAQILRRVQKGGKVGFQPVVAAAGP